MKGGNASCRPFVVVSWREVCSGDKTRVAGDSEMGVIDACFVVGFESPALSVAVCFCHQKHRLGQRSLFPGGCLACAAGDRHVGFFLLLGRRWPYWRCWGRFFDCVVNLVNLKWVFRRTERMWFRGGRRNLCREKMTCAGRELLTRSLG